MHNLFLMSLFFVVQNLAVIRSGDGSKVTLTSNSRRELEAENPVDTILRQGDYNGDYTLAIDEPGEKGNLEGSNRGVPFQRYIPVERNAEDFMGKEQADHYVVGPSIPNDSKNKNMTRIFEILKKNFHEHQFTISPIVICIILSTTIIVTCCCTIWLRNRIITCLKMCVPSKKKRDYNSLDEESNKKLTRSKFQELKQKYGLSSFPIPRTKSLQKEYTPVETVEAVETVEPILPEEIVETPPQTGCCGMCKSKKKAGKK